MFYREAGQFKTSYAADVAVFPIVQDRIGIALILGLFTRTTGFILSGEMAMAYFTSRLRWETPGIVFWPIRNNGEEAVLNCFFFLWLVTYWPMAWSRCSLGIGEKTRKAMPLRFSASTACTHSSSSAKVPTNSISALI